MHTVPATLIYADFRLETPVTSIIGKEGEKKSAFRDTQHHAIPCRQFPPEMTAFPPRI